MLSFNFLETMNFKSNCKEFGLADALPFQKYYFYHTTVLTTDRLNSKLSLSSFLPRGAHMRLHVAKASSRRRSLHLILNLGML